ncbi:MAG: hypothetical protein WBV60_05070 [Terriglobales bacterium]
MSETEIILNMTASKCRATTSPLDGARKTGNGSRMNHNPYGGPCRIVAECPVSFGRVDFLMLKLRGFFDESDTQEPGDKRVFLLGGWVTSVELWDRFSDDWNRVLHQPPVISYFKHNEAKGLSGQFEGWPKTAADAKILALARVIDRHIDPSKESYGFFTGMKPEMLRFIFRDSPASAKQMHSVLKFTTPYHFCFSNVISCVRQTELELNRTTPVDFVFDAGSDGFPDCVAFAREFKKYFPIEATASIGTITEGDDEELAPLQAADLLVGQVCTNLKQGTPDEAWRVLASRPRIRFNPFTTGGTHDDFLRGLAATVEQFNIVWSSLMLERAARKALH